ncbi:putative reverse transcriptase domain-containing protein [Tanacetum coccineum]
MRVEPILNHKGTSLEDTHDRDVEDPEIPLVDAWRKSGRSRQTKSYLGFGDTRHASYGHISIRTGTRDYWCDICALSSYACSDSLLLTPLCCDDIHEVTPHVFALAGCDRLVSEPRVIEKVVDRLSNARSRHGPAESGDSCEGTRGSFEVGVGAAEEEKLFVKFSKCELWLQEVHFLRHVVNSNGIHVDPSKIEAVKNWKVPKTPSGIQSFLGLAEESKVGVGQGTRGSFSDVEGLCTHAKRQDVQGRERAAEMLRGMDQLIERKEDGGMKFIWVPLIDDVGTLIMDKAHASSTDRLARLYINEIVARHGVPVPIISDRDGCFTSRFWQTLQKALGTRLDMGTSYHPQTDGQSERTIQTLNDMLRACVIDFGGNWDVHLLLAEFSYNNSYHSSIRCAPFKALYGRKFLIKEKLKAARDHQKSYADNRRKPLEFEVRDKVMLEVSSWKDVMHFGKKGKLALRYVRPFEILERIGSVAYRLRLPKELSEVHDTFHVSNLKKCLADANLHVPMDEIKIDKTLHFVEEPVEIIDREVKTLKCSKISIVKMRWNSKRGPEFTWEREDYMKARYPQLFVANIGESSS